MLFSGGHCFVILVRWLIEWNAEREPNLIPSLIIKVVIQCPGAKKWHHECGNSWDEKNDVAESLNQNLDPVSSYGVQEKLFGGNSALEGPYGEGIASGNEMVNVVRDREWEEQEISENPAAAGHKVNQKDSPCPEPIPVVANISW